MIKLVFFLPICLAMTLVYAATKADSPREIVLSAVRFTLVLLVLATAVSVLFYLVAGGSFGSS